MIYHASELTWSSQIDNQHRSPTSVTNIDVAFFQIILAHKLYKTDFITNINFISGEGKN